MPRQRDSRRGPTSNLFQTCQPLCKLFSNDNRQGLVRNSLACSHAMRLVSFRVVHIDSIPRLEFKTLNSRS
jgi:hypothetical protein